MKKNLNKLIKIFGKIKKIKLRKNRKDEKLTYKKIHARERKLSLIPEYILPFTIGIVCFWFFALLEFNKAMPLSTIFTSLIPFGSIAIYVKQATSLKNLGPIKSGDYFFKTKGYEKTVIRFEVLAKRLVPSIAIFIITTTLLGFLLYAHSQIGTEDEYSEKIMSLFIVWFFMIPFMVVFTMLMFRTRIRQWDDFEFHYALGCFKIAQNLLDLSEEKRLDYFTKGINHYDYFLRNNIHVRFNKLSQLFSKIITSTCNVRYNILEEIVSQMDEQSKFKVIACFVKMITKTDANSIFTPFSFIDRLKYWVPVMIFAGTTIGILFQVVPIFLVTNP